MENTSINLYCIDFFIVIKKIAKNRQEFLHRPNNSILIIQNFNILNFIFLRYLTFKKYKISNKQTLS